MRNQLALNLHSVEHAIAHCAAITARNQLRNRMIRRAHRRARYGHWWLSRGCVRENAADQNVTM